MHLAMPKEMSKSAQAASSSLARRSLFVSSAVLAIDLRMDSASPAPRPSTVPSAAKTNASSASMDIDLTAMNVKNALEL